MFSDKIEELRGKLGDLCRDNGYILQCQDTAFPIMFLLREEEKRQTNMLDKPDDERKPSFIDLIFANDCIIKAGGKVRMGADDLKKVISKAKKLHYLMIQQYFYRNTNALMEMALDVVKGGGS